MRNKIIITCSILHDLNVIIFRNQQEEDLRENHPLFDTPLFTVGRESKFRKFCKAVVSAKYNCIGKDPGSRKEPVSKYRRLE